MRRVIFFLSMFLMFTRCAPPTPTVAPTRAPLSAERAVQYALESQYADSPVGHLLRTPEKIFGELTTLDKAYARVNGSALPEGTQMFRQRERRVWLIASRGAWLLHIPGGHGDPRQRTPTVLAKDIVVENLWNATLLDAVSGDTIESGGIAEAQISEIETLPALALPQNFVPPMPTRVIETEVPLPTLPPAPTQGQ